MTANYRVLLVAPEYGDAGDPLETVAEVRGIQSTYQTEQLRGRVTVADIYELTKDRQFDIIHFAGHGDDDGIDLGGERLTMDMLARIARKTRAKLVYLNACDSARLGQYLLNRGVPAVVMTSTQITDTDAWSMAGYFYAELRRNGAVSRPRSGWCLTEPGCRFGWATGLMLNPRRQRIR